MTTTTARSDAVVADSYGIEATVYAAAEPLAVRARSISPDASRVAAEGMVAAVADLVAVVGGDRADEFDADLSAASWSRYIEDDNLADGSWATNLALRALHCTGTSRTTTTWAGEPTPPPAPELVVALARFTAAASALTRTIDRMAPA